MQQARARYSAVPATAPPPVPPRPSPNRPGKFFRICGPCAAHIPARRQPIVSPFCDSVRIPSVGRYQTPDRIRWRGRFACAAAGGSVSFCIHRLTTLSLSDVATRQDQVAQQRRAAVLRCPFAHPAAACPHVPGVQPVRSTCRETAPGPSAGSRWRTEFSSPSTYDLGREIGRKCGTPWINAPHFGHYVLHASPQLGVSRWRRPCSVSRSSATVGKICSWRRTGRPPPAASRVECRAACMQIHRHRLLTDLRLRVSGKQLFQNPHDFVHISPRSIMAADVVDRLHAGVDPGSWCGFSAAARWRLPLAAARCGSSYQSGGPPMLRTVSGLAPRRTDRRPAVQILDAVSLDLHHLRAARIGQKHVAVGNDRRQRYQAPGRVRLFAKIGGRLGGWGCGRHSRRACALPDGSIGGSNDGSYDMGVMFSASQMSCFGVADVMLSAP